MPDIKSAEKAKQIRAFFHQHGRIYIVVDATADDVDVPPQYRGDPALRLVLNVRMPQPIYIRDDALESDFRFGGVPYPCRIPMPRIWAMYVPGRERETGVIWEEDIPEVVRAAAEAAYSAAQKVTTDKPSSKPSQGPKLSVVEGGGASKDDDTKPPTKPTLKVLK
ncbi:MAG: hypothetical protein D6771_03160 [Zetaproteobacteria bacterium]|nr:MAG: hypothetical protein D6771_03160 [Zetaproteobacteria bacterium]